ncbi:MAG: hypothetical protein QOD86_3011 [Miltoncostaeaceae bacterium]|jgi:hypothetical protein|nr:hypothetical protein [Miltoncostaeaceae bacterium]
MTTGAGGTPPAEDEVLRGAIAADGEAFRALLDGRRDEARERLLAAAAGYRDSYASATPRSFGRLVATLKSSILAGDGAAAAAWARGRIADAALGGEYGQPDSCDSPTSCYALAVAALVEGDNALAGRAAEGMREGDGAFRRTADAIAALARGDAEAYRTAVTAIVRDFEGREAHLTGVPIADTALMLEALAAPRDMAAEVDSPLMPALPG